jgi:hypothetical protein
MAGEPTLPGSASALRASAENLDLLISIHADQIFLATVLRRPEPWFGIFFFCHPERMSLPVNLYNLLPSQWLHRYV